MKNDLENKYISGSDYYQKHIMSTGIATQLSSIPHNYNPFNRQLLEDILDRLSEGITLKFKNPHTDEIIEVSYKKWDKCSQETKDKLEPYRIYSNGELYNSTESK